jgi:hypothetical protein
MQKASRIADVASQRVTTLAQPLGRGFLALTKHTALPTSNAVLNTCRQRSLALDRVSPAVERRPQAVVHRPHDLGGHCLLALLLRVRRAPAPPALVVSSHTPRRIHNQGALIRRSQGMAGARGGSLRAMAPPTLAR